MKSALKPPNLSPPQLHVPAGGAPHSEAGLALPCPGRGQPNAAAITRAGEGRGEGRREGKRKGRGSPRRPPPRRYLEPQPNPARPARAPHPSAGRTRPPGEGTWRRRRLLTPPSGGPVPPPLLRPCRCPLRPGGFLLGRPPPWACPSGQLGAHWARLVSLSRRPASLRPPPCCGARRGEELRSLLRPGCRGGVGSGGPAGCRLSVGAVELEEMLLPTRISAVCKLG